ncbi:hypothetical protein AO392_10575 [Pseudomonas putida]|nr:hypothetical protein QV12_02040 [Pseudomonas putida]KTC24708.1 hypothetical protein AO392_10575 [Pseudomonas putida]
MSDFLAFSGLLSDFFADFLGSASFFLSFFSFFSEALERADAAADFFADDDFLSFKSLLAFEDPSLLFFSSLATLTTSDSACRYWHVACGIIHMLIIRRVRPEAVQII